MTIRQTPLDRDFLLYPFFVADGQNTITINSQKLTIPEGWYYNTFSEDANYPGLWTKIQELYLAADGTSDLSFEPATPTLSFGQVSCGVRIYRGGGGSYTVTLTDSDALPIDVLGLKVDSFSLPKISERNIKGVFRTETLVGGIASTKDTYNRYSGVAKTHDGPTARFTRWEQFQVLELEYQAMPAVYVRAERSTYQDYIAGRGIDAGDPYVSIEPLIEALTVGKAVILQGDTSELPLTLYAGTALTPFDEISDTTDVTRKESVAFERYTLTLKFYVAATQPQVPS